MQKIITISDLKNTISQLERQQAEEFVVLKTQLLTTYESLKPVNLIKNTVNELATSPDFKKDIFDTSFSLATGYLSKKIVVGSSHNIFKNIIGSVLQMGVSAFVSKNANGIRATVKNLFDSFSRKNHKSD